MACRLMALYLFMQSFWTLSRTLTDVQPLVSISTTSTSSSPVTMILNGHPPSQSELIIFFALRFLPLCFNLCSVVGLWFLARPLSMRLFEGGPDEPESEPHLSFGTDVRAVAFACLGLYFLVQDIPTFCLWILNLLWPHLLWTVPNPLAFTYGMTLEFLIRIPISLYLLMGLRGLAGLWRMAQEKGIAPVKSRSVAETE